MDGDHGQGAGDGIYGVKYVRGLGLIARQGDDGFGREEDYEYYVLNAHGDVAQLTDAAGDATKAYAYDAFGVEAEPDPEDTNVFRYCGEYFDNETGSYYLRARYFAPRLGRFLAEDPAMDGTNWYVYCYNNPVVLADSDGLKPYSTKEGEDEYGLYVSSQPVDVVGSGLGMIPYLGWGLTLANWATTRHALGQREIGYDISDALSVGAGIGRLVGNDAVKAVSRVAGGVLNAIEIGQYAYDWTDTKNYQTEEAIYNQFDKGIWKSSSRDLVDQKFGYAMQNMTNLVREGQIEVRKAGDVFGKSAFDIKTVGGRATRQFDPLTGKERQFNQNSYYFFMTGKSSAAGVISEQEKNIKRIGGSTQ